MNLKVFDTEDKGDGNGLIYSCVYDGIKLDEIYNQKADPSASDFYKKVKKL